jgi:hypothetical protein
MFPGNERVEVRFGAAVTLPEAVPGKQKDVKKRRDP